MNTYYHVVATVVDHEIHEARHLPTLVLDASIQGITGEEHARKIAEEIINPFGKFETFYGVSSYTVETK